MKALLFAFLVCFINLSLVAAAEKPSYTIKWVLAHEPVELFKKAAEVFSQEMFERTRGDVRVEVMTLHEYERQYNQAKKIHYHDYLNFIRQGKIEMSQMYTTVLGSQSPLLYVLDLPFLFRDHAHAQKVLEGKLGHQLLGSLQKSNLQGLAFTYSGGYRILPATKKITKLEDFRGLNVRTSTSPIAQETFKALGARPVPMSLDSINAAVTAGKVDSAESTYARYFSLGQDKVVKVMNETNHSLFLTSIIVNGDFWSKLPGPYRKIMQEAAFKAARIEREDSIKSALEVRGECLQKGIEINTLSEIERTKFKKAMEPVYKKFAPMFPNGLISSIVGEQP